MSRVRVFNLRKDDNLCHRARLDGRAGEPSGIKIDADEVDLVPVVAGDGFHGVVRIDVDLWERAERTKDSLQDLATRVVRSFQKIVGRDRLKVVIRPCDVGKSGWVSL